MKLINFLVVLLITVNIINYSSGQLTNDLINRNNHHHHHCNDNSWKQCINKVGKCKCYENPPKKVQNTIEKRIVVEYSEIIVERRYEDANLIFSPFIKTLIVFSGASYIGKEENVDYLYLGDPDISDIYLINSIDIYSLIQEGLTVWAHVAINYTVLHGNPPPPPFVSDALWEITFAANHTIKQIDIYVDTYTLYNSIIQNGGFDTNVTSLCTNIQNDCIGIYTQYNDLATCIAYMNSIPIAGPEVTFGNNVLCRSWHEVLARKLPSVHCMHTGTMKIDIKTTPCQDF